MRWSERARERLRTGETVEETVPVGGNGVVVTNQRLLAFTPDREGRGPAFSGEAPDIDRQLLIYPWMDPAARFDFDSYAVREEEESFEWLYDKYTRDDTDARNPYFAPLLARDFSDLPPATVVTAGFDALRDEGFEYADRLESAGVDVSFVNYEAMNHGFVNLLGLVDRAHDAVDLLADDLAATFE